MTEPLTPKQQALERLRQAYSLLDQAAGWIQEASPEDIALLGYDSHESLQRAIEEARDKVERSLDATRGDKWALGRILFDEAWPVVSRLGAALWKLGTWGLG